MQNTSLILSIVSIVGLLSILLYMQWRISKLPTGARLKVYLAKRFHNNEQLEADYLSRAEAESFVEERVLTEERAQEIMTGIEQRLNAALDTRIASAIGPASVPGRRLQRAEDATQKLIEELRSLLGGISAALQLSLGAEVQGILDAPDPERDRLTAHNRQAAQNLETLRAQLAELRQLENMPEACSDEMAEAEARRQLAERGENSPPMSKWSPIALQYQQGYAAARSQQLALIPGVEAKFTRAAQTATQTGEALSAYERDRLRPPEEDRLRKLRKQIEVLKQLGGNLEAVEQVLHRSLQSTPPPPPSSRPPAGQAVPPPPPPPKTRLGVGGPPAGASMPPHMVGDDELQESNPPPPPAGDPDPEGQAPTVNQQVPVLCHKCGNNSPPGSRFCSSCGGRLVTAVSAV